MAWLGLEGKVVAVTGGASGIGKACCEELASVGANVAVADINEKVGGAFVKELEEKGSGTHMFVPLDVASKESVEAMVSSVMKEYGCIDVLVNNAGINIPRLLVDPAGKEELTEEIWEEVVNINQKGVFLCSQAVARVMLKNRKGVIINMAADSGSEGSEGQSVYAATKAAIYNLTRSWAKELGKLGIRVVGIAPGILEATALRSEAYEKALAYTRGIPLEELRSEYGLSIPLRRAGSLSEVANLVCFLASDRAGFITGTTVNISGGKSRA